MGEPLRVTGACPVCKHTVTTTAPKGRLTWRGPCPQNGCKGVITARRSKTPTKTTPPPPAPRAKKTTPPAKTIKVRSYERRTRTGDDDRPPVGDVPPTGSGTGAGAPVRDPATPAPRPPAAGGKPDGDGRGSWRDRIRARTRHQGRPEQPAKHERPKRIPYDFLDL